MFYGFEERFYADAKLAELSQAAQRVRWKKSKANWAGSLMAKLRLILMAVPLASLMVSLATFRVRLPFAEQVWEVGLPGLLRLITESGALNFLKAEMTSPVFGKIFSLFGAAICLVAGAAALGLLTFWLTFFSFAQLRRMTIAIITLDFLGVAAVTGAAVVSLVLRAAAEGSDFVDVKMGFGAPVAVFCFVGLAVLNMRLLKTGVRTHFGEGDEERASIYEKVKAKTLKLEQLPYPVVETAETRALEEKIQAELERTNRAAVPVEEAEGGAAE
jgi:hypothetical protein